MPTRSFGFSSVGPDVGRKRPAQIVRDQCGERRLAEPRRSVEQHVIEGFAAFVRGVDRDLEILDELRLSDIFVERSRAQRCAVNFVFERSFGIDGAALVIRRVPRRHRVPAGFLRRFAHRLFIIRVRAIDFPEQRSASRTSGATCSDSRIIASASGRL